MARMLASGGRPRRSHSSIIIEVMDGTRNAVVAVPLNSSQARAASNDVMIRTRPPIISVPKAKLQYDMWNSGPGTSITESQSRPSCQPQRMALTSHVSLVIAAPLGAPVVPEV
jgi:hypothetical protein